MKHTITIPIDTDNLQGLTDIALAGLWHVTQANPADPYQDRAAGQVAEHVGREIIRRFVTQVGPELWARQGHQFDWGKLHLNKETTRDRLLDMSKRTRKLGNLFEGPDGCGTEGTDLAERIANDLGRLASMEHAGMERVAKPTGGP